MLNCTEVGLGLFPVKVPTKGAFKSHLPLIPGGHYKVMHN